MPGNNHGDRVTPRSGTRLTGVPTRDTEPVDWYLRWRLASPGGWLIAALLADLASYLTDARPGVVPWLLFDIWLAHRVWRGGLFALTTFRVAQTSGACLFGLVLVLELISPGVVSGPGPAVTLLFTLSAWCLMAPSLHRHVYARHWGPALQRHPAGPLIGP